MRTEHFLEDGLVVLELHGKILGGKEITHFHGAVSEYLSQNKRNFIVDLADVQWSNSLGLGMLVACRNRINKEGGQVVLANVTGLESLLAMTRLIRVFDSYDSREEAIQALQQQHVTRLLPNDWGQNETRA